MIKKRRNKARAVIHQDSISDLKESDGLVSEGPVMKRKVVGLFSEEKGVLWDQSDNLRIGGWWGG